MRPTVDSLDLEFFDASVDEDGIAVFRLNRPPHNAHGYDAIPGELEKLVLAVRFDPAVRVAVIASASERIFSPGADLATMREQDPHYLSMIAQTGKEVMMRMRTTPKVFIAAIAGHCVGGGLELALACDIRLAADGDYRLGLPEVKLGLLPGEGGTQFLPRTMSLSRSLEIMIFGELFSPREAEEMGLLDALFPVRTHWEDTMTYARKIARGPQHAIGAIKVAVNEGVNLPLWGGFVLEREAQARLFGSPDGVEGVNAYLDKRDPRFS